MKFLAQESQNENIEVPGEAEKAEGKAEDKKKSVVDEKATKDSEVKAESVKAQAATVNKNENAELLSLLKELNSKLDSKSETKDTTKNDTSELISALKSFVDKVDGQSVKSEPKTTKTTTQPKKSAEGFNPAEPSQPVVTDLAGAIALARSGNSQE